jgi:hypothetical protein
MLSRKPSLPEDLRGIDSALREARPELPEERVTLFAARARSRARAVSQPHSKEPVLRSRLAITFMLVFGFAFSGAGVGLAVTGISGGDVTSAQQQYPTERPIVSPEEDLGGGGEGPTVRGETEEDGPSVAGEESDVQVNRQLGAQQAEDELPFTGFAAIPVLLLGIALLVSGLVLRRRGSGATSA